MLSIFSANELFISQLNGPNFTAKVISTQIIII
jgi:hypothetical protein